VRVVVRPSPLPTNLDVEDWCLRRGTGRHEPTRQGTPAPSGTINWRYQDPTYFDAFLAGEVFELTANWLAPEAIEGHDVPRADHLHPGAPVHR
jgi:hypothetical protein